MATPKEKDTRKYGDKLAEIIKENQRRKEQRQLQEEMAKRVQLARDGRYFYERKDLKTALVNYRQFLQLTARGFGVEVKDLHPKLFDEKVRVSESLLISAITFDMAKIFDRVNGADKERALYLRLMVVFTAEMPFQFFVAENITKFIKYTPNIVHPNEFKAVHKAIAKGGLCFIASACFEGTEAPEVFKLRRFRDKYLWSNTPGRWIADVYYLLSPRAAFQIRKWPRARWFVRILLKRITVLLDRFDRSET